MQNRHYLPIRKRKARGTGKKKVEDSVIIEKAKLMFDEISQEQFVKDLAKSFEDLTIRIDLVGVPEAFFIIANENGKLRFITEKMHTDMAVGIHKEYFLELLKNPPQVGNMMFIYNNIIFRKGTVQMFKYALPLLSNVTVTSYRAKGVAELE